jgi:hypothetical protein
LNSWLIAQYRPRRSSDLLLRANLAPEDEAARAWRDWLRLRSIEEATWPEIRLLTPLARRIANLDSCSPHRPRLEGLAKAHWTRTQLTLRDSASALDALRSAGIDCLLFKGAAYYAEGIAPATRRVLGDVDILVPPEARATAIDCLFEAGWSVGGQSSTENFSCNFRKGEFGDIDLHRDAFHFSRRNQKLDAQLWENARPARLAGRSVLVTSPADSVVIGIAHGISSGDCDWAIDIAYRVSTSKIKWDRVAYIADGRGLVPYVLSGLNYLGALGVDIPASILDRLHDAHPMAGEYINYWADTLALKYWIDTFGKESVSHRLRKRVYNALLFRLRKRVDRVAKALLPRDRYQIE